ncbi:MAG: hypothetical protein IPP98_10005 [Gemmatimonadetes bacterium]|nr:hypothetical protein [Gemmatimonadota bacterium]
MSSQWFTLHLSSLTADDIATLLATELPSLPATVHPKAAEAVLLVTGGVPIYVMRALQRLNVLAAEGTRGDDLLAVIPSLVLHRDPAFPSGDLDRRVLGYLAIAGGTVVEAELAALADVGSPSAARDRLARLERSGWVERNSIGFQLSHDLVRQQAIEGLSPDERRDLSLQHARWLGLHGDGLHDLQRAVRISLAQGDEAEAVRAVRHWRRRVRGGPRGRALATIVLPADAPRGMRWRVSAAATPALLRLMLGMAVLLALGGWGVVEWLRQPARLSLDNTPSVPGIDVLHPGRVRRNRSHRPSPSATDSGASARRSTACRSTSPAGRAPSTRHDWKRPRASPTGRSRPPPWWSMLACRIHSRSRSAWGDCQRSE